MARPTNRNVRRRFAQATGARACTSQAGRKLSSKAPTATRRIQRQAMSDWARVARSVAATGSLSRCARASAPAAGIRTSKSTVRRGALPQDVRPRIRARAPPLSAEQEEMRVVIFRPLLKKPDLWFYSIAKSDEKLFDSNNHDSRHYYAPRGGPQDPTVTRASSLFPSKVMVWGVIAIGWRALVIYDKDESVTTALYIKKCLKPNLPELRGRVLLQDNAGAHTSDDLMRFVEREKLEVVPWSAKSCDANGIGNIWRILGQRVSARGPLGREQLIQFIREEWDNLPEELIASVVLSFRDRLQQIVANGGKLQRFPTKYKPDR